MVLSKRVFLQLDLIFLSAGLGLEYGDVPCAGTITGIGKVHGVNIMVNLFDHKCFLRHTKVSFSTFNQ